jgi:hypothetical protein
MVRFDDKILHMIMSFGLISTGTLRGGTINDRYV